jgi:hypothetical protein
MRRTSKAKKYKLISTYNVKNTFYWFTKKRLREKFPTLQQDSVTVVVMSTLLDTLNYLSPVKQNWATMCKVFQIDLQTLHNVMCSLLNPCTSWNIFITLIITTSWNMKFQQSNYYTMSNLNDELQYHTVTNSRTAYFCEKWTTNASLSQILVKHCLHNLLNNSIWLATFVKGMCRLYTNLWGNHW